MIFLKVKGTLMINWDYFKQDRNICGKGNVFIKLLSDSIYSYLLLLYPEEMGNYVFTVGELISIV